MLAAALADVPALVDTDREGVIVTDHARRCLWRILGRSASGAYVAVLCHAGGAPRCRAVPVELPRELVIGDVAPPEVLPPDGVEALAAEPAAAGWLSHLRPGALRPAGDRFDRVALPGARLFGVADDPVVDTPALLIRRSWDIGPHGCRVTATAVDHPERAYFWPADGEVHAAGRPLWARAVGGRAIRARATVWDAWCQLVTTPEYGDRCYLLRPLCDVEGIGDGGDSVTGSRFNEATFTRAIVLVSGSLVDLTRELVARGILGIGPASASRLRAWLRTEGGRLPRARWEQVREVVAVLEAVAALPPLPLRAPLDPSPGFEPAAVLARRLEAARAEHTSLTGAAWT